MEIDHWKSKSTNKDRAFCWASMTALRAWLGCPSLNHQQSQQVWENIGTFANLYSNQKGSTILFLASKALLSKSSAWCGIEKVRACLDQKQCALSDAHETPGLLPNKTSTCKVTPMASVRHGNCGVKASEPHEPRLGGLWLKSQNGYWRSNGLKLWNRPSDPNWKVCGSQHIPRLPWSCHGDRCTEAAPRQQVKPLLWDRNITDECRKGNHMKPPLFINESWWIRSFLKTLPKTHAEAVKSLWAVTRNDIIWCHKMPRNK